MVDPQRFELWEALTSPAFKAGAFDQLCQRSTCVVTISFKTIKLEVPPRFELGIVALQATALPLGDGTSYLFISMVPGAGLEPAQYCYRGILSPLRLPISPPGHMNEFTVYNNK